MVAVRHEGGYSPFEANVTALLGPVGPQTVVVRVEDDPQDLAKPRGKQDWLPEPHSVLGPVEEARVLKLPVLAADARSEGVRTSPPAGHIARVAARLGRNPPARSTARSDRACGGQICARG